MYIKIISLFIILICTHYSFSQFPLYGPPSSDPDFKKGAIVFSVINIPITSFNIIRIATGKPEHSFAGLGIFTGFAQVAFGFAYSKHGEKNEVFLNYIIGSSAIFFDLIAILKKQTSETSLSIFSVPVSFSTNITGIKMQYTF